ncbi:hypothetical protein DL98DRAFT_65443 [Cadophora sp. DSE1049]|nr:hypothetical protein DL98DRAFT_65443 [Cadophora sp. DSE1049]
MADSFMFGNDCIYTASSSDPVLTTSPFENELNPTFMGNDFYQTELEQVSPTWDSSIASPQFPSLDQGLPSSTSELKDALLFAESPFEESPQTPKSSGDYISLCPVQMDKDRKDSLLSTGCSSPVIDHMSSSHATPTKPTTHAQRHSVSESNYSETSPQSPSSESENRRYSSRRSSKGSAPSTRAHRLSHNTIEKRYRTNLNEQISKLWRVIATEKDERPDSQQPSKSAVLETARKYILELQTHNKRVEMDLEEAKKKCKIYEQLLTDRLRKAGVQVAMIGRP